MLKSKLKMIVPFTAIILALILPIVYAENEEQTSTNNQDISLISENSESNKTNGENESNQLEQTDENSQSNTTNEQSNMAKSDVYLCETDVNIDYIIDGNLFVIADNVTINSQIGGDAFICAKHITIGENGFIYSNLFSVSEDLTIKGVVYDVYSVAKNSSVIGYIYRDFRNVSESTYILGTIARNAFINSKNILFKLDNQESEEANSTQGIIGGDLNYTSTEQINIPEGSISGETKFTQASTTDNDNNIQNYLVRLLTTIVSAVIIWLLSIWLAPKFLKHTNQLLKKKLLPTIGFGLLGIIIIPIISIVLLIIGLTSNIGLLLLLIYFILMAISTSIFIISINNLICDKFNITSKLKTFSALVLTTIVLWAICLIPYLGSLVSILCVIVGMGILISSTFFKNITSKQEPQKTVEA